MLRAHTDTTQRAKSLRALFSLSVNTAADWKSLYLNKYDSVNAGAVKAGQVSQQHARSPQADEKPSKRRWADIEHLAPWKRNAEAAGHSRGILWHSGALPLAAKRAAQDHRACQTSTLDVPTIKDNLEASPFYMLSLSCSSTPSVGWAQLHHKHRFPPLYTKHITRQLPPLLQAGSRQAHS